MAGNQAKSEIRDVCGDGAVKRQCFFTLYRTTLSQVWQENLYEECAKIRSLIEKYNYVAMVCLCSSVHDGRIPSFLVWYYGQVQRMCLEIGWKSITNN